MAKKLWGGRFKKKIHPLVEAFTKSIQYDYRLAEYDLIGSILHVKLLKDAGILTASEATKLHGASKNILRNVKSGKFKPDSDAEDIHTNIQNILQNRLGDLALKLQTARSRNDQVVFAMKLYCKAAISDLQDCIKGLISAIDKIARQYTDIIIPGFTHMQHAQPVYLKDYLRAYIEMLTRDEGRLADVDKGIEITMGSGALAGTPIGASLYYLDGSKLLKEIRGVKAKIKIQATRNSLDTVSDRDFVIGLLSALALLGMHLSRLAEDLIIWSTEEFDFVEIDEPFCTGSSLMPQKKNPDALELVRGYAGRLYGNLVSVLTTMKGLPLTYNRDMQLDKEPLFGSIDIVSDEVKVLTSLVSKLRFNRRKIERHLEDESLYATDLVYHLVNKGVAFKNAHDIIGRLMRYATEKSIKIKEMKDAELKKFSDRFVKKEVMKLFDPKLSVASKKSIRRG